MQDIGYPAAPSAQQILLAKDINILGQRAYQVTAPLLWQQI